MSVSSVSLKTRPLVSSSTTPLASPSLSQMLVDEVGEYLLKAIDKEITRRQDALNDSARVWTRKERQRAEKRLALVCGQRAFTKRTMS